jgi:hypothetical protein
MYKLAAIGGKNAKQTVWKSMAALLGPQLAIKMNWYGKGKLGKKAFGGTKLAKLVLSKHQLFLLFV